MIRFFDVDRIIPFMRYGKITTTISLTTFIFSVWALWAQGLNLGVDFTGGTVMEVATASPPSSTRSAARWRLSACAKSRCRTSAPRATC